MSTVASDLPSTAPLVEGRKSVLEQSLVIAFMIIPVLALAAAVPLAWGWGLSWLDVGLAVVFYVVTGLGRDGRVPPLLHPRRRSRPRGRCGSRSPSPGSLAMQGPSSTGSPTTAATTRSPTRRATRTRRGCSAPARSRWPAASGTRTWAGCSTATRPTQQRFAPDLLADRDISRVDRLFVAADRWPPCCVPALLGGLLTWSWWGALTAFFWAGPGAGRAAAPRHLVDQLDLPHGRRRAVRARATARATSGRWRSCPSASRGTTCTTPTPPAPGTACSAARSTSRPG